MRDGEDSGLEATLKIEPTVAFCGDWNAYLFMTAGSANTLTPSPASKSLRGFAAEAEVVSEADSSSLQYTAFTDWYAVREFKWDPSADGEGGGLKFRKCCWYLLSSVPYIVCMFYHDWERFQVMVIQSWEKVFVRGCENVSGKLRQKW